jgi:hypothetical protein
LCTCCRHYPGAASGRTVSLTSPSRVSLPRKGNRVGLRIVLFEACSAFTRVAACTLALSPIRDTHSEGFSYFVTSIAAPVASGWSVRRMGLAPTGKRRLITAHTPEQTFKGRITVGSHHSTPKLSQFDIRPRRCIFPASAGHSFGMRLHLRNGARPGRRLLRRAPHQFNDIGTHICRPHLTDKLLRAACPPYGWAFFCNKIGL